MMQTNERELLKALSHAGAKLVDDFGALTVYANGQRLMTWDNEGAMRDALTALLLRGDAVQVAYDVEATYQITAQGIAAIEGVVSLTRAQAQVLQIAQQANAPFSAADVYATGLHIDVTDPAIADLLRLGLIERDDLSHFRLTPEGKVFAVPDDLPPATTEGYLLTRLRDQVNIWNTRAAAESVIAHEEANEVAARRAGTRAAAFRECATELQKLIEEAQREQIGVNLKEAFRKLNEGEK